MTMINRASIAGVAGTFMLAVAGAVVLSTPSLGDEPFSPVVDKDGAIVVPDQSYRRDWTLLGTWVVNGEENAEGVHQTYATPQAVAHYQTNGDFPDGAVLVKELRNTKTQQMTTGKISQSTDLTGWFVMVRDTEGRFKDNALWGEGWGWAYFDAAEPNATTTTNFRTECLGCHIPAKETNWLYVEGYPVLKD